MDIRWMCRRDFKQVCEIERRSFEYPWDMQQFKDVLRIRPVVGLVATLDASEGSEVVIGYIVYHLYKYKIELLNLAVPPHLRRQGIAQHLLGKVIQRSKQTGRSGIVTILGERNLVGQLFFRHMGFRATEILPGLYNGVDAAYRMELELKSRFKLPAREEA